MSALPIYVDTDPCPKCGTNFTTATWQEDVTERRASAMESMKRGIGFYAGPPRWWFRDVDEEHIEVKCNHCGYIWQCRTVDGWERAL